MMDEPSQGLAPKIVLEIFETVEKLKKERDEAFIELRGLIKGIKLGKLSPSDESFLKVVEMMMRGFKNIGDDILTLYGQQFKISQRADNLEKRMQELENNILQLRLTLDRMAQDR